MKAGGIGRVVAALATHVSDSAVQASGWRALVNLATEVPGTHATGMVTPMSTNRRDHDVCVGMGVRLWVTAAKAKSTALGSIDLVVAAMVRHLDSAEVQGLGCATLQVLAKEDAGA